MVNIVKITSAYNFSLLAPSLWACQHADFSILHKIWQRIFVVIPISLSSQFLSSHHCWLSNKSPLHIHSVLHERLDLIPKRNPECICVPQLNSPAPPVQHYTELDLMAINLSMMSESINNWCVQLERGKCINLGSHQLVKCKTKVMWLHTQHFFEDNNFEHQYK